MKNLFLNENVLELHPSLSLIKHDEVSLITKPFTRRGFLKTSAILAGGVVALDTLVFPQKAEAIAWGPVVVQTAKLFSKALLAAAAGYVAERGIEEIWKRIQEARLKESYRSGTFHDQFADPIQFDFIESPVVTRYRYYYGIRDYSETAPKSPIPVGSDLNVFEIWAVTHPANPVNHSPDGAFFIPYPYDKRKPPEPGQMDVFYNSSVIYDRYGEDPRQFDLEYVRYFSNGMDLLTGYGVRASHLRYGRAFLLTGGRA